MEKFIHRVESGAPIPNLVVNYGVYENVDKALPFTLICDRAFLAMKSIRDDYEHQIAFYDDEMRRRHFWLRLFIYDKPEPAAIRYPEAG